MLLLFLNIIVLNILCGFILCLLGFCFEEYEKLWAAVTGGRGTGRGTKKKIVKGVDQNLLKYGMSDHFTSCSFFNILTHSFLSCPTPPPGDE